MGAQENTFDIWFLNFYFLHLTLTCHDMLWHDIWHLLRSHKIYWDLTRSAEISYGLLIWQNTFDIWHWHVSIWHDMTFDIYWDLTQDLLRSHKIYWDLTRSIEISSDLLIWHLIFYILYLTFDIARHLTFDNWQLTIEIWHLTLIWHLTSIWHLTIDI